jgi:hypothetical protein
MPSLKEVIDEIKSVSQIAERDLSGWDPRTLQGVQAAKNEAKRKLQTLSLVYRQSLANSVTKVFLVGDVSRVDSFLEQAGDSILAVRGDDLYRQLATAVNKTMDGTRRFGTGQLNRLASSLDDFAVVLGVETFPYPKMDRNHMGTVLPEIEDVLGLVRTIVRNTAGDSVNRIFLEQAISNKALGRTIKESKVTAVIGGLSTIEASALGASLFPGRPVVYVNVDDANPKDLVKSVKSLITKGIKALTGAKAEEEPVTESPEVTIQDPISSNNPDSN